MTPADEPERRRADLLRKLTWHRIGYILSALWVGGILVATGGNVRHPLFDYIFIVPLAGWAVGLTIGHLLGRARKTPPRV
jgi:hypothetical protein